MTEIEKKRVDDAKTNPDRELSDAELSTIAAAGGEKLPPGHPSKPPTTKP